MKKFRIIYKLLLVFIWIGIIFSFSNQTGQESTTITNGFLEKVLWFIDSDFTFIAIRKIAHVSEYFILGVLIYNLIREFSNKKIIIYTLLICIILACFDEFHQLFVGDRNGQILDVLIDGCGSFLGIILINKILKKEKSFD